MAERGTVRIAGTGWRIGFGWSDSTYAAAATDTLPERGSIDWGTPQFPFPAPGQDPKWSPALISYSDGPGDPRLDVRVSFTVRNLATGTQRQVLVFDADVTRRTTLNKPESTVFTWANYFTDDPDERIDQIDVALLGKASVPVAGAPVVLTWIAQPAAAGGPSVPPRPATAAAARAAGGRTAW